MIRRILLYLLLTLCAVGPRLIFLGIYPPGKINSFWLRLPSACAGILTIYFLFFIVKKLTQNERLAYISSFVLALMPWHLEQSRVISSAMIALLFILIFYFLLINLKKMKLKLLCFILTAVLFIFAFPNEWFIQGKIHILTFSNVFYNVFKLVSYEFLFSANDAFWSGGMRKVGVFLPFTMVPFLIGLYNLLKQFKVKELIHYLLFCIPLFLAVFNPLFPEQREYIWITPYFAIVVGLGFSQIIEYIRDKNPFRVGFAAIVLCLMMYDYVLFFHYYIAHYSERVKNEIPYENRRF